MKTRTEKLEGLKVLSPCESSWEAMSGDARRRHCAQCDKPVYDFALLSPREIAGVVEAHRGSLCARLTRDGAGRLVTLQALAVAAASPQASRWLPSPSLGAALVTAVLGLGAAGCADRALAASPAAGQSAGEKPVGDRPAHAAGDAGSTLRGRLTTEAGEPIGEAVVTISNQLDGSERVGRTEADGSYAFTGLRAGVYGVAAAVRGQGAADQGDVLLAAGDRREVGLTVPTDTWQRIQAGGHEGIALGGAIALVETPLRIAFTDAELALIGVAGKSVVVHKEEYSWQVRTDLTVSAVLKGETRERVISVFHDEQADDDAVDRLQAGETVLAFLAPHEAENGRGEDGYVGTDQFALRTLTAAAAEPYERRLEALERITRDGRVQPDDLAEWLVATAEDPATRQEATSELADAARRLDSQAEQHQTAVDRYAQSLRTVFDDFVSTGGRPEGDVDGAILGAFLTADHRERLTTALQRTPRLTSTDLQLYEVVKRWHQDRLLPWLEERLRTADPADGATREVMSTLAGELDDPSLDQVLAQGEQTIGDLEEKLGSASGNAARERIVEQLGKAEEELARNFIAALARVRR